MENRGAVLMPRVQCGAIVGPWGKRCLRYPDEHPSDHPYESLGIPCTHCGAAIYWRDGDWRDTLDGTGHAPDARYLGSDRTDDVYAAEQGEMA